MRQARTAQHLRNSSDQRRHPSAVGTPITGRPQHKNRTCGFPAYGSQLGCLTAKRTLSHDAEGDTTGQNDTPPGMPKPLPNGVATVTECELALCAWSPECPTVPPR